MSDDLVQWLRAQLDDDERVIREAAEDYFYADGHGDAVNRWFDRWCPDNPTPMLAEVDAKRRILDRYQAQLDRQGDRQESQLAADICATEYADWVLPVLALPYASRPGYRPEWAP